MQWAKKQGVGLASSVSCSFEVAEREAAGLENSRIDASESGTKREKMGEEFPLARSGCPRPLPDEARSGDASSHAHSARDDHYQRPRDGQGPTCRAIRVSKQSEG